MSTIGNYTCIRCKNRTCEVGQIRAAGGFWSKIFDVDGRRFTTVSCQRCKHTELFAADSSKLENIFDLFVT
jgi:predicted nucleic-acid-binding Zn-ribbon protein